MHADIQGALKHLDKSWKSFTHNGKPLLKNQVKEILQYGLSQGYETTEDFKEGEIDGLLSKTKK